MSDALLYEFSGVSADDYLAVNAKLGLDPNGGGGDWPAGMISHTGAAGTGSFFVFEVWDSKQSQEAFMESRLGPALGASGIPAPMRTEWLSVVGYHARAQPA
jgi:hypothetical protein